MDQTWKKNALKTIEGVFRRQFLDDRLTVSETTSPTDIEEWDSLAHVNLLASVENEFGIRFTADDLASIATVGTMLRVLSKRRAA